MTHPYQEMKDMKKHKKHYDMLGYICDAQYGIPTRCPCGGEIKTDVSPNPKYRHDFDTFPGSRYFTCKNYEIISFFDDGMHFRQPWAFGVEDEMRRLRMEVNDMAEEIAKLKRIITSTSRP
ncbi:BnaA08g06510D [Brassica napus]|uniref:BnaA08g06510D protein n=1 Tax=Brassica napus TaxID=3708 RepID=A0A078I8P2_BRANA|nr:BnaA08g06510D [Brassica napus]